MKKINSLSEIAELVNSTYSHNLKAWEKAGKQRLYFPKTFGYNTKKMSTSAYIDILSDKAIACVYIDCPSQPDSWIQAQQQEVCERMQYVLDLVNDKWDFPAATDMELILNDASLEAEEVKGYYTEWRHVRVAINSYGKLALRNRQFVVALTTTKAKAPANFVALSDEAYTLIGVEEMLDPYQEVPDYEARVISLKNYKIRQEQEAQERQEQANAQEAQRLISISESKEKMMALVAEGSSFLAAWKHTGCIHPAPAEVVEAKKASGLNWKNFIATI